MVSLGSKPRIRLAPSRRSKILIVDADSGSALGIHQALYNGLQGSDALVVRDAEAAQQVLCELFVDVLIAECHLPKMSGLELARWVEIESPETRLILTTSGDVASLRSPLVELGCFSVLRKPINLEDLCLVVQGALENRDILTGHLAAISVADLIQMLCLGQRTTRLRISTEVKTGSVVIVNGKLTDANWGNLRGESAIYELVGVRDGIFSSVPLAGVGENTIEHPWQYVLMEAVRRLDEKTVPESLGAENSVEKTTEELDSIPPSVRAEFLEQCDSFEEFDRQKISQILVERGFFAVRAGNVEHAKHCWRTALKLTPGERAIEAHLENLEGLVSRG